MGSEVLGLELSSSKIRRSERGKASGKETDGSFLVYFDHPPDILKFDKTQLRPHHHWTGFTWQKKKDKEVSKDMFSTGKLVEMTRTAEYELQNIVEVFVGYGWRKGVVKEIHIDNHYKVCFEDTKEEAVFKNSDIRRFMEWQNNVWIEAHMVLSRERMSTSADKIVLPKRVFEPGSEKGVLDRVNKHCTLKYVAIKDLWFSFGEQVMRFSLREFHLATGLPCLVGEEEKEEEASATKKKKKDPWMWKNHTVKSLVELFVKNSEEFTANQKLRLGATILVGSILIANNPVNKIPVERLLRAINFKEFCKYPWGNETYDALRAAVEKITIVDLVKEQYRISGFIYAIQLWALSSVDQLGSFFGDEDEETQFPLCLHWIRTKSPTMDEVVVKCILGDPELHSNLVEDVDTEQDWHSGSVNIAVAEAEIEENNYGPGTDATDKEKIEFLTKQLEIYKERVEQLEDLLGIRRETEKKKTQDEEEQLVDNDAEDGEKERETSKDKERNTDEKTVNDDTVVDEDSKADEPNQGAGASTSKSKKQKIQTRDVSADDVIGGVLEDLNLKEQEEEEQVDDEAEKPVQVEQKKRGRPGGRKNKTNDEAEKPEKGGKNKPGRKGKTNEEKKQQVEADDEAKKAEKDEKKKPRRPAERKGKTNEEKKQQVEADDEAEKPEQVEKRKLGRPAGRKRAVAGTSISEKQKAQAGKDSTDDPE
ncbi:hypothetical protein Bca52824_028180 [Brassica carinata]|uniref:Agenet domain-containing protein n=1 Tax=Brassica carinata TaxID=52824 RepID=A0A8X7VBS4_BRACI|nr:hypothetical protein Bca52824_028180 [Brassica carinata]